MEYDKQPELFFEALLEMKAAKLTFQVTLLGDDFAKSAGSLQEAQEQLADHIVHAGYLESALDYQNLLLSGRMDVVVSTALHEFQGLAILEATLAGIFPLCPYRLAYPEYLPPECLYKTDAQFKKKLRYFAKNPSHLRHTSEHDIRQRLFETQPSTSQRLSPSEYRWSILQSQYRTHLKLGTASPLPTTM
jgi:glycosyltransferase involved in cell wall biosynthesis